MSEHGINRYGVAFFAYGLLQHLNLRRWEPVDLSPRRADPVAMIDSALLAMTGVVGAMKNISNDPIAGGNRTRAGNYLDQSSAADIQSAIYDLVIVLLEIGSIYGITTAPAILDKKPIELLIRSELALSAMQDFFIQSSGGDRNAEAMKHIFSAMVNEVVNILPAIREYLDQRVQHELSKMEESPPMPNFQPPPPSAAQKMLDKLQQEL